MRPGLFLCGCDPKDPHVKNYSLNQIDELPDGTPILSGKRYDKQGREICPIHGKHLYGHASPTKTGPQGNEIIDYHKEYVRVYGKATKPVVSSAPDLRDNSDAAAVGAEYLARKVAAGNGHSTAGEISGP